MVFDTTAAEFDVRSSSIRLRAATRLRAGVWSNRTFALLAAVLIVAEALAFLRWQVDRAVVPWDSKNHFFPMFRFLGDALRSGTLPLWNPYHFGGYPAVADPQSLIFTPTMVAMALIMPQASMPEFDAIISAHLVAGAIGILGLGRRWRWHPAAALLAAFVFMLGGSAAARLQHTGMIISYAVFPWALWSLQTALDRRSLRLAVLAGGIAALMALGRDQVAYLLCLALAGSALRLAFRAENPLSYLRSRTPVIACAAIVTVAIMAVPILLTLQFLHDSNRPGVAFGTALEGSLNPVNLLTLLAPNVFGSLDPVYDYWGPGAASVAGNDWTDRSIDYLFAGTLPFVLIAWHGIGGSRVIEAGARFFVLLTSCALLYAVGRHTPLFEIAFDWLPGVSLYRRPADATFVANIGVALLSGYLLHRFVEEGLPRWPAALGPAALPLAVALPAGALLVGSGLTFARQAGHLQGSIETLFLSGLAVAAATAVLYLGRNPARRRLAALVLVCATGAELVWYNAASPLNAEPISTYSAYSGFYPDQARGLAVLQAELAERRAHGEHPRVELLGLDGSWQNVSMMLKLENTVGYNPLRIAEYERAVGVGESANDPKLRTFPETFRGYNSRLAALLGLDYLVLDRPMADLPRHVPRPRGDLLFAGDHFYVYRLAGGSVPRVTFTADTRPTAEAATPEAVTPSTDSVAAITTYADDTVVVDVRAPAGGLLVLHDLAYPGWEAAVDGTPQPIRRADLLFRGVEVPAGHHTVEFAFHPFSVANIASAATGVLHRD